MIFDLPARETTEPYWMKIDDRIHYKKAQMIYTEWLNTQYLRDMYTLTSDVQLRPSRHIHAYNSCDFLSSLQTM